MLVVDWNQRELRIVAGKLHRGRAVPFAAVRHAWPPDVDRNNAEATGAELRKVLDASGLQDRDAAFCVERRLLVLKRIPLPDVAEEETHGLLRLQALRDLTIPVEQAVIDFLRVPPSPAAPFGQAILAVLQRETLEFHAQLAAAAGLKLKHLFPGSLARAEAARLAFARSHPVEDGTGACQALVVVDDRDIELILQQDGRFMASVARPIVGDDAAAGLTAALRRSVATLATQWPQQQVVSLLCAGADLNTPETQSLFAGLSPGAIRPFDPLEDVPPDGIVGTPSEARCGFAGPIGGLLLAARAAADRIDFLKPKQPAAKVDRRRPLAFVAAGVVLVCGMQLQRYYANRRDGLDAVIKKARADEATLAKQYKTLQPRQERAQLIAAWQKQDMHELDVLDRLFQIVAAEPKATLVAVSMAPNVRGSARGAAISVEGLADAQPTIAELFKRLGKDGGFEVRPGPVQPTGVPGGKTALWRFSAELSAPAARPTKEATS